MHLPDTAPMLAVAGRPPNSLDGWVAEPKLDGWRARVTVDDRGVTVRTRTGRILTHGVTHLDALTELDVAVALDAELAVGSGTGDDFALMPAALGRDDTITATLWVFDLTWLDTTSTCTLPYVERRAALEALQLEQLAASPAHRNAPIRVVPVFATDEIPAAYTNCERLGMEGLVLKRVDSTYQPGQRSRDWHKVKTPSWMRRHAPHRRGDRARRASRAATR